MNTSCGDTVKCRLDAGKSPIFRSQSPCTYIYVQESQRFWDFLRIYTYESRKWLTKFTETNIKKHWSNSVCSSGKRQKRNESLVHSKSSWNQITIIANKSETVV